MAALKEVLPVQPRGTDRRSAVRPGQQDWRVNQRTYEFIGAEFDPLTPVQTLARAKWMTVEHGFRYIVTPNVDHLVRMSKEPEVFGPLYAASWLSVCDSRILEILAKVSGIPLKAVPGSTLTQQLFDNVITKRPKDTYDSLAQIPFTAPTPEGWPDTAEAWIGPDSIIKRVEWAKQLSAHMPDIDARDFLKSALGLRLSSDTLQAVSRAESAEQAFVIALMSPDFQRR